MLAFIVRIIQKTNWQMVKPAPYGTYHLLFTAIGLTLVIVGSYLLRKSSEKTNKIVLLSCGIFLFLIESYKIIFYIVNIENGKFPWGVFPWQLCSIPIYLCLFTPFLKPGKVRNALYTFMATINFFGGAMGFIEPSGILHSWLFLTLHASVWHMMLVFIGAYLMASGRAVLKIKEFLSALVVFAVVVVIAQTLNIAIFHATGRHINMLFISPYFDTSLAVFKDITLALQRLTGSLVAGRLINGFLTLFAMALAGFVVTLITVGLRSLAKNRKPIKAV